jgi:3-keto-5-aminohexanoate cleavage enzyme
MDKLIITCAISGAEVMKEHNPFVPYTVAEIAEEAYQAYTSWSSHYSRACTS